MFNLDFILRGNMTHNRKAKVTVEDLMLWGHYSDDALFVGLTEEEVRHYLRHPDTFVPTPAQLDYAATQVPDWSHVHSETIEQFLLRRFSKKHIEMVKKEIEEYRVREERWRREHGSRRHTYLRTFVRWKSDLEIENERAWARRRSRGRC